MYDDFYAICVEVDAFCAYLEDEDGLFADVVEAVARRRGVAIPA